MLGRALAKSDSPVSLEEDATAGCKKIRHASAAAPYILGCGTLLAGVVPERALAKSDPPTVDGCEAGFGRFLNE